MTIEHVQLIVSIVQSILILTLLHKVTRPVTLVDDAKQIAKTISKTLRKATTSEQPPQIISPHRQRITDLSGL